MNATRSHLGELAADKLFIQFRVNFLHLAMLIEAGPVVTIHFDKQEIVRNKLDHLDSLYAFVTHKTHFSWSGLRFNEECILELTNVMHALARLSPLQNHHLPISVVKCLSFGHNPIIWTKLVFIWWLIWEVPRVIILQVDSLMVDWDAPLCHRDPRKFFHL